MAIGASIQPYKYNNKELDVMHGVNLYDYSARQKDDWRFTTIDPLAEKFYSWSPYVYCKNNPINRIDPDGLTDYYFYLDAEGNVLNFTIVDTKENSPNHFFVQDINATQDTENRKEYEGSYFQMAMIPSSEYSEDDYMPKLSLGFDSQFDIDRRDYVWGEGTDYTDSKFYERLAESINDNPDAESLATVVLTKGKNSSNSNSSTLGGTANGKGERKHTKSAEGTNNPYKHLRPDPNKPGNVLEKNTQPGKWVSKKAPEGYIFPNKK